MKGRSNPYLLFQYRWLIKGLSVEAGVNNLFDENYEIDEGYPEEGINYFANLTYKF